MTTGGNSIDDFVPDREPTDSFRQFLDEPNAVLPQNGDDGNFGLIPEEDSDDEESGTPMVAKYQEDLDSEDEVVEVEVNCKTPEPHKNDLEDETPPKVQNQSPKITIEVTEVTSTNSNCDEEASPSPPVQLHQLKTSTNGNIFSNSVDDQSGSSEGGGSSSQSANISKTTKKKKTLKIENDEIFGDEVSRVTTKKKGIKKSTTKVGGKTKKSKGTSAEEAERRALEDFLGGPLTDNSKNQEVYETF